VCPYITEALMKGGVNKDSVVTAFRTIDKDGGA
jgi:hypothetical protein